MTDDERRELVREYKLERIKAMKEFHRQNFNGKTLYRKFRLERQIVDEFIRLYGEETSG